MQVRVRTGETVEEQTVHMAAAGAASRGRDDLDCPPEDLVLAETEPGHFRVEGCGDWASYRCDHRHCALEDRGALAAAPAATSWTDDHVRAIAQRVHDDVAACLPSGVPSSLRLRVRLSRTGRVMVRDRAVFPPGPAGCVGQRLVAIGLRGSVDEGRTVLFTVQGATFVDALAPAPVAAPDPLPEPEPEIAPAPDVTPADGTAELAPSIEPDAPPPQE